MYTFVYGQPHAKVKNRREWYLILEPGDVDTLMKLHKGVTLAYFYKFGFDPPVFKSELLASLYHPMRLAASWLESVEKFLATGVTLAVNFAGGMLPLDSVEVFTEEKSKRLLWPRYKYRNEVITISHWPEGRHYHLSSDKGRVFTTSKYNTYALAHQVARMYTKNIQDKGC